MTALRPIAATGLPWPTRRDIVLAGLLTAIGAASVGLKPVSTAPPLANARFDAAVPHHIGPWRVAATDGLVTAPADELAARLYDRILTRIYRDDQADRTAAATAAPGATMPDAPLPDIALLIAYGRGQDTDVQLHRPDACYPAQGFALSDPRQLPMRFCGHAIAAQIVTATRGDLVSHVVYWTRIGDRFPTDAAAERAIIVRENLAGRMPDAALVRISIDTADRATALVMIRRFIGYLGAALPADGRRLLIDGLAHGAAVQRTGWVTG